MGYSKRSEMRLTEVVEERERVLLLLQEELVDAEGGLLMGSRVSSGTQVAIVVGGDVGRFAGGNRRRRGGEEWHGRGRT